MNLLKFHIAALVLGLCILVFAYQQCAPFRSKMVKSSASKSENGCVIGEEINYAEEVAPVFQNYCMECHDTGDHNLSALLQEYSAKNELELFRHSLDQIEIGSMPTVGRIAPTLCEQQKMSAWLNAVMPVSCTESQSPGHVVISRLTGTEYNNTIKDLTGLNLTPEPASGFLSDFGGAGFDNVSDSQVFSETHMEQYYSAAERIATAIYADASAKARIFVCSQKNENCARQIFRNFGAKAYRRPITAAEETKLYTLVTAALSQGDNFDVGVQLAIKKILSSPSFLYRPVMNASVGDGGTYALNNYELASRLSYFLWNSMPDQALTQEAAAGRLTDPVNLSAQVDRMLDDPKAQDAFSGNFLEQWLRLRNFENILGENPPYFQQYFPEYDNQLGSYMLGETKRLFNYMIAQDKSILELLTANYTFATPALAQFYGLTPAGEGFQKIPLNSQRRGILTHASVLAQASTVSQRDIIRRGLLVLSQVACWKLGARPDVVPPIAEEPGNGTSLREVYSIHARSQDCAVCHNKIDPLGFAFENYNAIGKWQTQEFNMPLDASGSLPDGRRFTGALNLVDRLIEGKDYQRCVAQKVMTYALGRGVRNEDMCLINKIATTSTKPEDKFSDFIKAIVTSDAFTKSSNP